MNITPPTPASNPQSVMLDLTGDWEFAYTETPHTGDMATAEALHAAGMALFPCSVPGNFELDILAARGEQTDLFRGLNILEVNEMERMHIWYTRTFSAETRPGYRAELLLEGIDCYAEIYLNGQRLANTDNMLIEHVIAVDGLLQGENELLIHIRPAVIEAAQYPYPPRMTAGPINYEALYVRKAPHMYGWDIMPRAVSAGIWRPLALRYRPLERLEEVFLETSWLSEDHLRAGMGLHYRVSTDNAPGDRYQLTLTMTCGDSRYEHQASVNFIAGTLNFEAQAPRLWWPRGAGEAHLYAVEVALLKNGSLIDSYHFTHGVRKVELKHTEVTNANGDGDFCFIVNHQRIFIRGSNWVPLDAFHSRDAARVDTAVKLAVESNSNLLRCWGGNVYESDRFFDLCDANGIMIWQDFAMACAVYPQDEEFRDRFTTEVRAVVKRLRRHASLALWSGDNECDEAYQWNSMGDPNLNVLTRQVIPGVLRVEDGTRSYLPSSPYYSTEAYRAGGVNMPEAHLWGPRDYFKSDFYMNSPAHFTSEIGYLATPVASSIHKFITQEHCWPMENNAEWTLHCTSPSPELHLYDYRVKCLTRHLSALFGPAPVDFDTYIFASQAAQAEAYKFFIERFRGTKWRRTGIIWWNQLDGWPQFSDSVVDYYFVPKLAYYFIANVQQPLSLICQEPQDGSLTLVATNDTLRDITLRNYTIKDLDSGAILAEGSAMATANALTTLAHIPIDQSVQRCYIIEWSSDELGYGSNHFLLNIKMFIFLTSRVLMPT